MLRLLDVADEELTGEQLWPLLAADGEPELAWRNQRALAAGCRLWGQLTKRCSRRVGCDLMGQC